VREQTLKKGMHQTTLAGILGHGTDSGSVSGVTIHVDHADSEQ
jgi:hypothetical protein